MGPMTGGSHAGGRHAPKKNFQVTRSEIVSEAVFGTKLRYLL